MLAPYLFGMLLAALVAMLAAQWIVDTLAHADAVIKAVTP
jgi:hypothetical protein